MKLLFKILLIVFLTSGIYSCGSRKTQKSEVKEVVKTEAETNKTETSQTEKKTDSEIKTEKKTDVLNDISETDELLEPINPDKPIIKTESEINGVKTTTWENAKVNNSSKTDKSKASELANSETKIAESEKSKTDREENVKEKSNFYTTEKIKNAQSDGIDKMHKFSWFMILVAAGVWAYHEWKIRRNG